MSGVWYTIKLSIPKCKRNLSQELGGRKCKYKHNALVLKLFFESYFFLIVIITATDAVVVAVIVVIRGHHSFKV